MSTAAAQVEQVLPDVQAFCNNVLAMLETSSTLFHAQEIDPQAAFRMGNSPAGARLGGERPASCEASKSLPSEEDRPEQGFLRVLLQNHAGLHFELAQLHPAESELAEVAPQVLENGASFDIPFQLASGGIVAVYTADIQHAASERTEVDVTRRNRKNKEVLVAVGRDSRDVATGQVLTIFAMLSTGWLFRRKTLVAAASLGREAEDWSSMKSKASAEGRQGCCSWRILQPLLQDEGDVGSAVVLLRVDKTDSHVLQHRQNLLDSLTSSREETAARAAEEQPALRGRLHATAPATGMAASPLPDSRGCTGDLTWQAGDGATPAGPTEISSDEAAEAAMTGARHASTSSALPVASPKKEEQPLKHIPEARRRKVAEVALSSKRALEEKRRKEAEEREFRATFGTVVATQDLAYQQSLLKDQLKDLEQEQLELQQSLDKMIVEIEEVSQLYKNAEDRLARYGENPKLRAESTLHSTRLQELRQVASDAEVRLAEAAAETIEKQELLEVALGSDDRDT